MNEDPGTHNYLLDNRQAFYRMVGDHFYKGQADYNPKEIPSESEVKTRAALGVPLPTDNVTIHSLALSLSRIFHATRRCPLILARARLAEQSSRTTPRPRPCPSRRCRS